MYTRYDDNAVRSTVAKTPLSHEKSYLRSSAGIELSARITLVHLYAKYYG